MLIFYNNINSMKLSKLDFVSLWLWNALCLCNLLCSCLL